MIGRVMFGLVLVLAAGGIARAQTPVLYVEDPQVLQALEARGHDFAQIFSVPGQPALDALIAASPAYKAITDTIAADVATLRAEMKAAGRPLFEQTTNSVGRVLDMRWLSHKASRFRLAAVVNRLDRRDFHAAHGQAGTCGEVRFVYRLAYSFDHEGRRLASRMPFNFNAVYTMAPKGGGGCASVARAWEHSGAVDAAWLTGGPLQAVSLSLKQLELNAQIVRFPSEMLPPFGGQASYLMRIFGIEGGSIVEKPLENTPDAARIAGDAALKARLADYVRGNAAAIDLGVYQVPDEFLARKIISFTTFGSARLGNHPFTPLLPAAEFSSVDFSGMKLVGSPEALVERLDNGTCQGCHQAGSTAGFHVIGLDDETTGPLNRIEVGVSPHLHAEMPRREAYLRAVAAGREPNRFRPLSFAPPAQWEGAGPSYRTADVGMSCLMPDDAGLFSSNWQCGGGTTCQPLAKASGVQMVMAQCLLPRKSREMFSGHPCLTGSIATNASQPYNDRYKVDVQFTALGETITRSDYTCRPPKIGVPGGIAYRACTERDRNFANFKPGEPMPNEICGLVGGKAFDICVASGEVDQCLAGSVVRGNRQACSADNFCREDYMCQAMPPDTPGLDKVKGVGFCSPTYFIFQMRIDNHTTPWDG